VVKQANLAYRRLYH